MEVLTAAVVLAWLVLVVLAFAMAGLLRQFRDVQAVLTRLDIGHTNVTAPKSDLPESVRPQEGKAYATLLVDQSCPICVEVAPLFARLASGGPDDIDFVVVARRSVRHWHCGAAIRLRIRYPAHQLSACAPG